MGRGLNALATPGRYRGVALAALAGLWIIVPGGALVRLTDSGLGCPDWPLCEGSVVPETAGHGLIEFGNRGLSALVMATCVFSWLVARRIAGRPGVILIPAAGAALAAVGQVPLGALTVLSDLHPVLVSSHFVLSMVALALGALAAVAAFDRAAGVTRRWDRRRGPLAALTALALGVGLVTGVLVTAAGPHSGDPAVVDRLGDAGDAAFVHVRTMIVFAALALVLAAWVWREGGTDRATRRLVAITVPLIAVQIAIGEFQFREGLPWEVVLLHVALAALVWTVTVALTWRVARPAVPTVAPVPAPSAAPRRREALTTER